MRTHWERLLKPSNKQDLDDAVMEAMRISLQDDQWIGITTGTTNAQSTHSYELMKEFSAGPRNIYRFADTFAQELVKCNLDGLARLATEKQGIFCIEILGCAAYVKVESLNLKVHMYVDQGSITWQITTSEINDNLSAYLQKTFADSQKFLEKLTVMTSILNALVYLNSGNPDLREYRPVKLEGLSRRERDRIRQSADNPPQVPVTLVGFDWLKPPLYSVDNTQVRGHFRWQPVGVGRAQVRLTWVTPHTRTYNT
jgi:hypothetical protein